MGDNNLSGKIAAMNKPMNLEWDLRLWLWYCVYMGKLLTLSVPVSSSLEYNTVCSWEFFELMYVKWLHKSNAIKGVY